MISYIVIIILAIAGGVSYAMYLTVKRELRLLQETFQLKVLAKHIGLTREIEALSKIRTKELDFTELDKIIENLRRLHNGQ